jgi:hypothetical protein
MRKNRKVVGKLEVSLLGPEKKEKVEERKYYIGFE